MKTKLTAGLVGCSLVLLLFYQRGFLNKALLPGFYLSSLLTVSGEGGYGKPYYVLGLAINAAIFSYIIFCLLSPEPLRELRRHLTRSGIICVALLVLFVVYALPIGGLVYAKRQARNSPELWIVPTPLPNVPIERSEGLKFSYFGYEFEVPWNQLKQERKLESMVILNFVNGGVVVFPDPSQKIGDLDAMKQEAAKKGRDVRNVFGDQATRSNYAMRSKILYLTPKDLSLFSSRQEMVTNSVLLLLKPVHAGIVKGGLYSFQTEWLRGFQEGSPAKDLMTIIDGFDDQDHEVELWVGSEKGTNKPSQADINRILYSLRPDAVFSPH
jgi:hypothetical protein